MPVHIDCNAGFGPEDLPVFRALDRLGFAMIEQPLGWADLIDHARLQAELETPLCLDESITSPAAARQAVETSATRKLNIKHGRVGGLTNALAIHRYCREAGGALLSRGMRSPSSDRACRWRWRRCRGSTTRPT